MTITQKSRLLIIGGLSLLVLVLLATVGRQHLLTLQQRAAAADFHRHMRDPAYLQAQTSKLLPAVEGQITASFPQVVITPSPQPGKDGATVYGVHLPANESRDLPRLHAHLARLYGTYRRQGFHATFLIYQDDKVVRSVP